MDNIIKFTYIYFLIRLGPKGRKHSWENMINSESDFWHFSSNSSAKAHKSEIQEMYKYVVK